MLDILGTLEDPQQGLHKRPHPGAAELRGVPQPEESLAKRGAVKPAGALLQRRRRRVTFQDPLSQRAELWVILREFCAELRLQIKGANVAEPPQPVKMHAAAALAVSLLPPTILELQSAVKGCDTFAPSGLVCKVRRCRSESRRTSVRSRAPPPVSLRPQPSGAQIHELPPSREKENAIHMATPSEISPAPRAGGRDPAARDGAGASTPETSADAP